MRTEEQPSTLAEVHAVLLKRRPPYDAGPQLWAEFHRHSAEIYAHVAKVDARHRHEAGYWAAAELRQARDLEDNPPPKRTSAVTAAKT